MLCASLLLHYDALGIAAGVEPSGRAAGFGSRFLLSSQDRRRFLFAFGFGTAMNPVNDSAGALLGNQSVVDRRVVVADIER
jgi:hypothetical protein